MTAITLGIGTGVTVDAGVGTEPGTPAKPAQRAVSLPPPSSAISTRFGYTDGFDDGAYAGLVVGHEQGWNEGHAAGQRDVIQILDANGFVVYDGEFIPASYVRETFSDKKGMRYGGVGLIAVGAIVNLVWPDSPARLSVSPLRGGGSLGASFGF